MKKDFSPTFIDVFAGCGGLSLGLSNAGWRGLFAIEKDAFAFQTLAYNLIGSGRRLHMEWPSWLPKQPIAIESFVDEFTEEIRKLEGKVDLLSGGPPCQGFSTYGRRRQDDPRNQMFRHYVKLVHLLKPRAILIENVRGITTAFSDKKPDDGNKGSAIAFSDQIYKALEREYIILAQVLKAKDFGVPQIRPRYILFGLRRDLCPQNSDLRFDPFGKLKDIIGSFLVSKGLPTDRPVTVREAISDLKRSSSRLHPSDDTVGFKQGSYGTQESAFQRLMHGSMNETKADSHRFPNHLPTTIDRFTWLQKNCMKGKKLRPEDMGEYATRKHSTCILAADEPSHTVTTLPDDLVHYSQPRVLTVREMARLQSFPDWFEFKGKYTTGGHLRTKQCPRYTQVGNAVPPMMAEALGIALMSSLRECNTASLFSKQDPI